jgi:hypothetical protein
MTTGLFARLSARAGGFVGAAAETVRPRLTSSFEQDALANADAQFELVDVPGAGPPPLLRSTGPSPGTSVRETPPVSPPPHGAAPVRANAPSGAREAHAETQRSRSPETPPTTAPAEDPAPAMAAPRTESSAPDRPTSVTTPSVLTTRIVERSVATDPPRDLARPHEIAATSPASHPRPSPPVAAPEPSPLAARLSPAPAVVTTTAALVSRIGPVAAPARSAPDVVVTIGRVEVRATTAPAAPTPRAQQRDGRELDAYLRRRQRERG